MAANDMIAIHGEACIAVKHGFAVEKRERVRRAGQFRYLFVIQNTFDY